MTTAAGTWMTRGLGVLTGAGAVAAAYATWVEPRLFALRRVEVPVLPAGAQPVRVLHLSDLHLVPRQHRKRDWVRALAELEPDLVVNTGDNLAAVDAVPAVLDTYGELLNVPGVFVLGSNDYYGPKLKNPLRYLRAGWRRHDDEPIPLPVQDLIDAFTARSWVDLTNTRARLDVAGLRVDFAGVDDPHLGRDVYPSTSAVPDGASLGGGDLGGEDLGGEVSGGASPMAEADLRIGVTHAPYQRTLDTMVADGAEVVFAGHTHGGQLQIPGYGALVTNCDLDTGRVAGLSRWWPGAGRAGTESTPADAAWLHVSAGLGSNPYTPFRFSCRPEASLVTLMPRQG